MPSPAYDGPQMGYGVLHCPGGCCKSFGDFFYRVVSTLWGARRLSESTQLRFRPCEDFGFSRRPCAAPSKLFHALSRLAPRRGKSMAALRSLDRTARRVAGARHYQTAFGCVEGVQSLWLFLGMVGMAVIGAANPADDVPKAAFGMVGWQRLPGSSRSEPSGEDHGSSSRLRRIPYRKPL